MGAEEAGHFLPYTLNLLAAHLSPRALEGPVDVAEYEGASGSVAVNHGLPRFARCAFAAAYPLAQVKPIRSTSSGRGWSRSV